MTGNAINVLLALMIVGSFLGAIALHEYGHALMAALLGDPTPNNQGRQSLRLRAHLDPLGTLMCIILAFQPILAGPVGFGWGKPVKPDPWKMRVGANPGVLMVACAGPIFSLLIGILAALILRFIPVALFSSPITIRVPQLILVFASVNICLTLFNLLPLYPLDGYQIVYTLLPSRQAIQFAKSATYGPFIILAIFFLLPFIAMLSGLGNSPLFRLPYYILLGSLNVVTLVTGSLPHNFDIITLYLFNLPSQ